MEFTSLPADRLAFLGEGVYLTDLPPHTSEFCSQIYLRLLWNLFWTLSQQQLGSTPCDWPSSYWFWTGNLMDNSPSSLSTLNALIATVCFAGTCLGPYKIPKERATPQLDSTLRFSGICTVSSIPRKGRNPYFGQCWWKQYFWHNLAFPKSEKWQRSGELSA